MTWPLILLGLGLLFVVAEILFPSFGILGTLAALSIAASCGLAFKEDSSTGVRFLVATAVLVPVSILTGLKLLPWSPFTRKFVAEGFSYEDPRGTDSANPGLLDAEGVVEAPLRPAGTARLGGRRVDVISRGEHIERGTPVRVVEVEGNRVVVTRLEPTT